MAHSHAGANNVVVLVGQQNGLTVIPSPTPLTSLNYFDGKFLRADDLMAEKRYVRQLVELSNQAGGSGVVQGFDTTTGSGDNLSIGPGMAIDPAGRVLLLPTQTDVAIGDLIDASQRIAGPGFGLRAPAISAAAASLAARPVAALTAGPATALATATADAGFADCVEVASTPPSDAGLASDLYVITIAYAEALCGQEDVYGKLCDEACVTSTDRPFRVEGIVVRAVPLALTTPLAISSAVALDRRHLRSRVASAYFADDTVRVASLISRAGLAADTWCLGARLDGGSDVPIAVIARSGSSTVFLDAWTVRRERMEAPARRYWARRMAMRPWDGYLAQILQFQCQLHDLLLGGTEPGADDDPCRPQQDVMTQAADLLQDVETHYTALLASSLTPSLKAASADLQIGGLPGGLARIASLRSQLQTALRGAFTAPRERVLIGRGIVELPPAGYLPVVPGSSISVNDQVRRLLGEGLDLRFCVVRPDFVPHALEEAQHMERISLLQGLDHPDDLPRVDVLVPNGQISQVSTAPAGIGFAMNVRLAFGLPGDPQVGPVVIGPAPAPQPSGIAVTGAGRGEITRSGGMTFSMAGATEAPRTVPVPDLVRAMTGRPVDGQPALDVISRVATTPATEHAAIVGDPRFANRLRNLAGIAGDFTRATRLAAGSLDPATAGTPQLVGDFAPALAPGERRVVALWASMATDADVRTLGAGQSTTVRFETVLASPSASPTWARMELLGTLRVDAVQPTSSGQSVTGAFSGTTRVRQVVAGGPVSDEADSHDLGVTLIFSNPAAGQQTVTLRLQQGQDAFVIATTWTLGPTSVTVRGVSVAPERQIEVLGAEAVQNADVLVPGNDLHTVALSAIEIIGAALGDPAFRDAAIAGLFPPPPPPTSDLNVQATMDWVLFHRRRDITCGVEAALPPVVPARRYALFGREVQDPAEAEAIRKAILSGDAATLVRLGLKMVDTVEFAGGQAALSTPASALLADWQASGPGELIMYSVIASPPPGDGDVLTRARLGRLVDALGPVTPADPAALSELIPTIPAPLAVQGTDGAIVVLTRSVVTTCISVSRVDPAKTADGFQVTSDGAAVVITFDGGTTTTPLGDVVFAADQTDIRSGGDVVQKAWEKVGAAVPFEAVIVSAKGDDAAGTPDQRTARGQALLALVGAKDASVVINEIEKMPDGSCPVVAFLVDQPPVAVATDCMLVYRTIDADFFKRISAVKLNKQLQALLDDPASRARRLGPAVFDQGAPSFAADPGPTDLVRAWARAVQIEGHPNNEITMIFSRAGDAAAGPPALRIDRMQTIFKAFGVASDSVKLFELDDPISGDCPAIAVIFAVG